MDLSVSEAVKAKIIEKLDSGFVIEDKRSVVDLYKIIIDELKLSENWRTEVKRIIKDVMVEKGLDLADKGFSKNVEGMKVKIIKESPSETIPQQELESTRGALPKQEQQATTEKQAEKRKVILTDQDKKNYEIIFQKGFSFLVTMYAKFGLVEAKDVEPKEKITLEEYKKETDELANAWADYCYRNNIELPKYLELIILCTATFAIFGLPVINLMVFGKKAKKTKQDETLKDIGET